MNKLDKLNYVRNIAHTMAHRAAYEGKGVANPEYVDQIAAATSDIIPDEVFMSLTGDKLASTVSDHIQSVAKEIVDKNSGLDKVEDKQANAHGGANMDYFDTIMIAGEQTADKTAALGGSEADMAVRAADTRMGIIRRDPIAAIDAAYVKTAALQDVVVKLASVVEQLTNENADDISATQGNAKAENQGGEGITEITEDEIKSLANVTGEGTGRTNMKGDPTGKESDITDPKNAENGNGGIEQNPKPTTGDLIASAKQRSASVGETLKKIKEGRKNRK